MGRKRKRKRECIGCQRARSMYPLGGITPPRLLDSLNYTEAKLTLLSDFFWVLSFVEAALSHLCFVLEAGQLLVSVIRVEKKPRHLRTRLKSHPLHRFGEKIRPDSPSQRSPAASNNRTNGPQARTGSRERGERGRSHR